MRRQVLRGVRVSPAESGVKKKRSSFSRSSRCAACRARFLLPYKYPATVNNHQPRASVAECSAGFVAETLASKLQTVDAKDGGVLSGVRG